MKYSNDLLRKQRTIKEAKIFCDTIFDDMRIVEWRNFFLKKGKDRFYKDFWDEYYPLSLYSSLKYPNKNYFIHLCGPGNKIDAEIINVDNCLIKNLQITTTLDYKDALRKEKLINDGWSLGVGKFHREVDGTISQCRGLRSPETALHETSVKIINAINKKFNNNTYENINVLLVVTESRFNNVIQDYYNKLKNVLRKELKNKISYHINQFKEIYLIDFSNVLIKL